MSQRYACVSCRTRKLKCDRKLPCANCISRGIKCSQQQISTSGRPRVRHSQRQPSPSPSVVTDILARLNRIESTAGLTTQCQSSSTQRAQVDSSDDNEPSVRSDFPDETRSPILADTSRLVNAHVHANDDALRQAFQHDLALSISESCAASPDSIFSTTVKHSRFPRLDLPPKEESIRLFEIYVKYIGHFQNILYDPHVRLLIDDVYNQITHVSTTTAPRGLALILSISAIAVLLAPLDCTMDEVSPIMQSRLQLCAAYTSSAMDCLEQARRRMYHTFENVQAMVILSFLITHLEAFSLRYRILAAETFAVARILGLHKIDAARAKSSRIDEPDDPILMEMKRRVWWYLVATNWMVTLANESEDLFHPPKPHWLAVKQPLHIWNADLATGNFVEKPLSEPTSMSYFLARLRVAEAAKFLVITLPEDVNTAPFELVSHIDAKIEQLVEELPPFLKSHLAGTVEVQTIDQLHPFIPLQRLIISMMTNLLRCKLHHPYLIGSTDAALHAFSRETCLKAARNVLAAQRGLSSPQLDHAADFMKLQGTVHHMFMGAIILAMDLCCNMRQGAEEGDQRNAELMQACTLLARVKEYSQIATKFLNAITSLMVKYGVWEPLVPSPSETIMTDRMADERTTDSAFQWQFSNYASLETHTAGDQTDNGAGSFEDLWKTFVERPAAMDMIDFV